MLKKNTAIHEFVHLIDKTDGTIDGIPELLLEKQYTIPWIDLIKNKIDEIYDIEFFEIKDKSQLIKFLKEIKKEFKPDFIVNIGDLLDFHAISMHSHDSYTWTFPAHKSRMLGLLISGV